VEKEAKIPACAGLLDFGGIDGGIGWLLGLNVV
jgi:hypothetical protein